MASTVENPKINRVTFDKKGKPSQSILANPIVNISETCESLQFGRAVGAQAMRSLPLILCLLLYLPADCAESISCAERAWAALEHPTKLPQQLAPYPQPRRFKEVSSCHSSSNLHVTGVECNFCGTFALDVTYPMRL